MLKHLTYIFLITLIVSCKSKQATTKGTEITTQTNEPKIVNGLIQDCPEKLIINGMPSVDSKQKLPNRYYIYKGFRKEIKEFDSTWVSKHCKIKETFVQ